MHQTNKENILFNRILWLLPQPRMLSTMLYIRSRSRYP